VAKSRKVHPDGIRFEGFRYLDPTLAAYVGEPVIIRYDPHDMAEIRIFHDQRFLCRAICAELAGDTIALRDIIQARNRRRRALRHTLRERARTVEALVDAHRGAPLVQGSPGPSPLAHPPEADPARVTIPRLKRYFNE
jgi:putative transposase